MLTNRHSPHSLASVKDMYVEMAFQLNLYRHVWNTLQDHWKLYQKKHYARDDNQVEELRELEEECEASDEDDWQIDMPDGG